MAASEWGDARVVHHSVQGNHVHLVAEADSRRVLAGRVQGLEVRRVIEYVLKNHRHHFGGQAARFDPRSSAAWFDGWRSPAALGDGRQPLVRPPKSWLLRIGWRRHGLLEV